VIIMTGYVKDDSTKQMIKQEPNLMDYIEKPVRPQALLAKVHKILNTITKEDKLLTERKDQPGHEFDPNMRDFGGF